MMNTSFEDQASQSNNTDQQSETSSVNPPSPRSTPVYNKTSSFSSSQQQQQQPSGSSDTQHQHHHHHLFPQDPYLFGSGPNNHQQNDMRNLSSQHRLLQMPIPPRNPHYSGVDKLIMAAMLEESYAASMGARGPPYLPSGRGLGYFPNAHDTYTQIPTPSNKSELDLYRLLERANLLSYFGTFLNLGGDDVQQLSDADEEEFLEIMSLVGMTQKPLHVRRLQKVLIDWRENRESNNTN